MVASPQPFLEEYTLFDRSRRAFGTTGDAVVDAPITDVWDILRNFGTWQNWCPTVYQNTVLFPRDSKPDAPGSLRAFSRDVGTIKEQLLKLDEVEHRVVYGYIEGPADYLTACITTVAVDKKTDDSCQIYWSTIYQPANSQKAEKLREILEDEFSVVISHLQKQFYYNLFDQTRRAFGTTGEVVVDVPLQDVWTVLRDFGKWDLWYPTSYKNLSLHPAGTKPDSIGTVREFDGSHGLVREELLKLDEEEHRVVYGYVEGPADYLTACITTVAVDKRSDNSCQLYWSSIFQPAIPEHAEKLREVQQNEFSIASSHLQKHFYYNLFDQTRRAFGSAGEGVIDVPAGDAWKVLRDFGNWDLWWPNAYQNLVVEPEGALPNTVGCVRAFDRVQGRFKEELLKLDDEHRRVVLGYIDGPKEYLTACITTVAVDKKTDGSCILYWSSIFQPASPRQAEKHMAIQEAEFKEGTSCLESFFYYNLFDSSRRAFGTTGEGKINAPIGEVWKILRDFGNWDKWWPTAFANLELQPEGTETDAIGCVRTFDRMQGKFQEKLLKLDEKNRRIVFGYVGGPPGFLTACITTVAADKSEDDSTQLYWSSILQPARVGQSERICRIQESEFEDGTLHLKELFETGADVVSVQLTEGYVSSSRWVGADYVLVSMGNVGVQIIPLKRNGAPQNHEPVTFRVKSLDAQLQFIVMDTAWRKDRTLGVGAMLLSNCDDGQEFDSDIMQDGRRVGTVKARVYISPTFNRGKKKEPIFG